MLKEFKTQTKEREIYLNKEKSIEEREKII
jgi:hypothetical protein